VAAFERLERDGRIIGGALLPTPREDAAPCAGQGPPGRLVCLACIALLLIIDLCPEGMPCGCRRPLDTRVAPALWTLEAPVHPGLLAAPLGHWHDPGLLLECGVGGVVCGPAGRKGFAIPRQCQRMERAEDEKVRRAQGRDHGPCGACEAAGHGLAVAPRTQRGAPRLNGLRGVSELQARTFCGASRLETHIMCGICPVDPKKGSKGVV
jgi:hypothetical protein